MTPSPRHARVVATAAFAMLALAASAAHAAFPGVNGEIAFTVLRDGDDEIYVMSPDGSGQTRLTHDTANDSAPAFSRDGSRIAFQTTRIGFREIFGMDADGSGQTNLTSLGGDDVEPSFSTTGRIAYSRNAGDNFEIFTMNADGSGQVSLTKLQPSAKLALLSRRMARRSPSCADTTSTS